MPELPEVETMVRGIRPYVTNRKIVDVFECSNSCRPISMSHSFRKLREHFIGKRFSDVRRIGKRLVFDLSDKSHLVIEPRMTGLVLLADPPDTGHLRLQWQFQETGQFDSLWFWDRRGLGVVRLLSHDQLERQLGFPNLGPDALEMSTSQWIERCGQTQREIKVLLLDQKMVAGIGNLYASEILHVAGIHPTTPADLLTANAITKLTDAVQAVLLQAIECEGSTLGDGTYRNALNKDGSYQNLHRVYMKPGEVCQSCQTATIVRTVQAQRSTFFCPECQTPIRRKRPSAKKGQEMSGPPRKPASKLPHLRKQMQKNQIAKATAQQLPQRLKAKGKK